MWLLNLLQKVVDRRKHHITIMVKVGYFMSLKRVQ